MTNSDDTNALSKEELQREMEAKRDKIANTVDEIRHTLSDEVRDRKQAMREAVDWHTYVNKNPAACVAGAVAVGVIVGKLIGKRIFEHEPEPTWRDRAEDYFHGAERKAQDYYHGAERKLDEWRGRAQGESKWKARTRSAMSSSSDLIVRELMKTAQRMIIPTVVAAVTGKMASDNKTTIVEKDIHKTPGSGPDIEVTKGVTEIKNGEVKTDRDDPLTI